MTIVRSYLLALSVFCFSVGTAFGGGQATGPVPGRFVVKLKASAKPDLLQKALGTGERLQRASKLVVKSHLEGSENWDRFYVFTSLNQSLSPSDVLAVLGPGNIEYVEPDYYLELFDFPTDHLFPHQWYLYNTGQQYWGVVREPGYNNDYLTLKSGTPDKDIRLVTQYLSPPSETTKVVIAIVDTGTDLVHPDLQGRFWKNPDEIADNGVDDDHNGFVDDTLGYDVSGDVPALFDQVSDNDPTDSIGHGTHIAGIVAAKANGQGVVGIAPWAQIMPVKI
ncbi:MAG: S8 family serine peptidase, partial [Candidatus Zixiibacteriota bacterium]